MEFQNSYFYNFGYFIPERKRFPNLNDPCDALGQSSSVGLKIDSFTGSSLSVSGIHSELAG